MVRPLDRCLEGAKVTVLNRHWSDIHFEAGASELDRNVERSNVYRRVGLNILELDAVGVLIVFCIPFHDERFGFDYDFSIGRFTK